jgi:NitT/TauT family transport system substrate-binding protein
MALAVAALTASVPATAQSPQVDASPAAPAEVHEVSIGVANNILATPFYVGVDEGIYLDHGIDLKSGVAASGTESILGLQSGQYQMATNVLATILPAISQGLDAQLFGLVTGRPDTAFYDDGTALIAGPDLTGTTVADLRGKTVGLPLGTVNEVWLRRLLAANGMNADTDVHVVNVKAADLLATIQSRSADAVVHTEPTPTNITTKVPGAHIITRGGGLVDGRLSLYTTRDWLTQNPDLADAIIAANLEAMQAVREDPAAAAEIAARYLSGDQDPAVLAEALSHLSYDPRWSDLVPQGFQAAAQDLFDEGAIVALPDLSTVVATDLLSGTEAKYPEYFSDLQP